jgi:hypothetical protein
MPVLAVTACALALLSAFARPDKGRLIGISGAALGLGAVALMVVHFVALHARIDEAMAAMSKASASSGIGSLAPTGLITVDLQAGWLIGVGFATMGALLAVAGALARRAPLQAMPGGWR